MAKKRKAKKRRNPKRKPHRKARRSSAPRPKKNTRRKKRSSKSRARRPKKNPGVSSSSSYTVVFPSAQLARGFIESFPSKSVRAAYRKELTPMAHGAGFKSWRVSRSTADRMATAITQRMAYEAGRRRRRFSPPKLRIVARA